MQDNYFQFTGHYYQQTFGTIIWGTRYHRCWRIFSWLFWKHDCLSIFPKVWIRYVNDIFCVMKKNTVDRMNQRHNTIKFTYEVEDNETLCFLDTFNIYRKSTATSRYIPIKSHHSNQHKQPSTP
jgi:hypothetical protein